MANITQVFWRKVTAADYRNVERGPKTKPTSGGGQLYFSISFGRHLDHAAFGSFLGVEPPDAIRTERPTRTIDVHMLSDPRIVGPLEFHPRYQDLEKSDRYYIARQNRRRPTGERHPAWMPEQGFPHAPPDLDSPKDPAIPDLSLLKIVVLRSGDGKYYATFFNSSVRPPELPAAVDVLFQPNASCRADGLIDLTPSVPLKRWRTGAAMSKSRSREGLQSAPEIEEMADELAEAAGGRPSGQGFRSSSEERRAIELRAMKVATSCLKGLGWTVRDVSAERSYDLHCIRRRAALLVEIKGTTGDGSAVLLTPNEVTLARDEASETALMIVSGIELSRDGDHPVANGGRLFSICPWNPDSAGTLHPIGFRFVLDPGVGDGTSHLGPGG